MPGTKDTIRLIVVTTAGDRDDESRGDQPLPVIFDKALREVGGQGNQEPFALEYNNEELSGRPRTAADQHGPGSDDCLSRRAPSLLLGRAPTPQASRATITQTAMQARA